MKKSHVVVLVFLTAAAGVMVSIKPAPATSPIERDQSRESRIHEEKADSRIGEEKFSELRIWIAGNEAGDPRALRELIHPLVKRNPQAVADFASSLPDDDTGRLLLCRVAQAWAERDPGDAARWARHLRNGDQKAVFLETVCYEFALIDPAGALNLMIETAGWEAISPAAAGNLAVQWARQDEEAVLRWAKHLDPDDNRDAVFHGLARVRAESAPEEAAHLVSEWMPAGALQEEAAIFVVSRWAEQDVTAATSWAETFEDADLRERALREIAIASSSGT